ncbi:DMT family transporter [Pseudomonas sp. F1_0610]|uniref:DMT family transporter n=1 Tax=Pseudomonas sp. F1_0610 TaxID=3114284 RepID=UPI0039C27BDC
MRTSRPFLGAAFLALSALLFAAMGVAVREASANVNNETIVFVRNLVGFLFFIPMLMTKGFTPFKTQKLKSHFWRGFYGLAAMYCFFYAIAHLPLSDAMVFTYAAPVFMPFIAYFWLKEPLSKRVLFFSLLGLVGVLLVAKPSNALFNLLSLVGLGASIMAATAYVSIREMSDTEPAFRIVFYFALFSTLLSSIPLIWAWQPVSSQNLLWMGIAGLLAAFAQITMSKAYTQASPTVIGPFAYSAIIFAGIFGWMRWNEVPDIASVLGALLIIASSVLALVYRKR